MDLRLVWCLIIQAASIHVTTSMKVPCGAIITDLHGQFTTPNYPNQYPNDINCKWNITVPNGYQLRLNFTQFEIESTNYCSFDYVKVKANKGTIGTYCGRRNGKDQPDVTVPPLDPLFAEDNTLEVELHTDHSNEVEVHGFEAHFAAIDIDECKKNNGQCKHFCHNFIGGYYCSCRMGYKLADDKKSCIVQCQNIYLHKNSGIIASPEYPSQYPPDASCDWHITAERGYFVNIEFLDFHIEEHHQSVCPYDKLMIEDEEKKFGPFCGRDSPKKYRAASNWLIVEFFSDASEGHKGFKAKYWLEPIKCSKLVAPDFGFLTGAKNFTFKEIITYKCEPGYEYVKGSLSRTCQQDGTWNGTLGMCQRITCPAPMNKNSIVVLESSHGPKYYYNNTVKANCPFFYDTIGSKEMVCQADGTWSGGDAYCMKTCGKSIYSYKTLENCTHGRYRAKSYRLFQPWLVAIKENGKLICTGALISKEWVLTAGHCIADASERYGEKGKLELVLGAFHWDRLEEGTVVRKVKRAIMINKFDYGFHSDVTLLQLSSPIENMNKQIEPICLPSDRMHRHMFRSGKNVATIGWYQDASKGTYMTDRCVQVMAKGRCTDHIRTTHQSIHKKRYGARDTRLTLYPTDIICTNATRGSNDLCGIHPGSPLVAFDQKARKWYLGGIYTWGSKEHKYCKEYMNTFDMFSKVNKYIKWIRQETRLNLKNPDVQNSRIK